MKQNVLSLRHFFAPDQIIKIKICHIVTSEHPQVIKGRQWFIVMDVIDSEESSGDGYIEDGGPED